MIAPSIEKRLRELAQARPRQIRTIKVRANVSTQLLKYKIARPISLVGFFAAGMVVGGVEHKVRPQWRPKVGSWFTTAMRTAVVKILYTQGQQLLDSNSDQNQQND